MWLKVAEQLRLVQLLELELAICWRIMAVSSDHYQFVVIEFWLA
jgi:hypothetical protein